MQRWGGSLPAGHGGGGLEQMWDRGCHLVWSREQRAEGDKGTAARGVDGADPLEEKVPLGGATWGFQQRPEGRGLQILPCCLHLSAQGHQARMLTAWRGTALITRYCLPGSSLYKCRSVSRSARSRLFLKRFTCKGESAWGLPDPGAWA